MTNRETNEYLVCQRQIVLCYKQKIEQLLEDLKTCNSVQEYEEAMNWSRQYAAVQAKALQTEMEETYGPEKAQAAVKYAMDSTLI